MTNRLYPSGREAFLTGAVDWTTDTIKAVLVDTDDYTYDDAHDNLDDVAAGARVSTATLANTATDGAGVADADDVTFSSVSGDEAEALILYVDSGLESTSTLIAYIDTATGLPITPTGADLVVAWNAQGIFRLGGVCS